MNTKEINHTENGYDVKCTHSGQKQPYGDTFREFTVITDKPMDEVTQYCKTHVSECELTTAEYLADERAGVKDFGDHFRSNYRLTKTGDKSYRYIVTQPSTH